MKQQVTLYSPEQGHSVYSSLWAVIKPVLRDGKRVVVKVEEETRSHEQNSKLWALLTEVSQQVDWYGKRLTPEDWKHVFSASLRKLEVVPNIEGTGFVALGLSTSRMTKAEFSDLIELIHAFGAERSVVFADEVTA